MNKVLVIDADFLKYRGDENTEIIGVLQNVDSIILEICELAKVDWFILALSKGPYIKKTRYPSYKSKRKEHSTKEKLIESYLKHKYKCMFIDGYEADDIVLSLKAKSPNTVIIASQDKDVFGTIEGTHIIPLKKDDLGWSHKFITVTDKEAKDFKFKQLLMGDTTDSITGVAGIGEVTATKLITDDTTLEDIFKVYVYGVESPKKVKGLGIIEGSEEFLKNHYLLSPLDPFKIDSPETLEDYIDGMVNEVSKFKQQITSLYELL